jgi:hypothetical protein
MQRSKRVAYVNLGEELKEWFEREAERQGRTVSNLIGMLCRNWAEGEGFREAENAEV